MEQECHILAKWQFRISDLIKKYIQRIFFTIQIENEQLTLPTKMRNSLTSSSLGRSLADLYDTVDFLIFSVSNRPWNISITLIFGKA